jgi:D-glycero-D-manno-heptose 1,7-bisphosphate phosphatase
VPKARAGLLSHAASELGVDLQRSFMIGDSERDIEAGHRAGCQAILVKSGYGQQTLAALEKEHRRRPDHVSADILGAVNWILEQSCEGKTV